MIRSALLRMQLQESLGAASADALATRLDALAPELRRALAAIDATYQRFGGIQQAMTEIGGLVVSEWDMKSGRIDAGKAWKSLLGYAPDALADTLAAWRSVIQTDDLLALSAAIGTHVRESTPHFAADCRCRCESGNWRWLRVSGRVVQRDANNEPLRLLVLQQDIDAARQMEANLLAAREAAESAGRSRTAFLANMSHEIRTPMNAILGMTELALDTQLDAEQRHYLATVRSSCESLLAIVNDILDFSKIEAGKLQVERIDFDLREIVLEAVRSLAIGGQQKGLDLVVELAPDLPARVWGDPLRLRQVLVNLVGNAIKFTETGSVAVAVALRQHRIDGAELAFAVRDTGIGIPHDRLGQLFQAFSQADASTTRRFGGTGLGLAISARLVELMGGRLQVSSEEGRGSTFAFSLAAGVKEAAPPPATLPARLAGQRALLVGADDATQRLVAQLMGRWKLASACATSVAEAHALAAKWRQAGGAFALVVLDASAALAGDGAELAAWRADAEAEPMLTLVSIAGQRDQLPRLRALGLAVHVVKPIAERDLFDATVLAAGGGAAAFALADFDVDASLRAAESGARALRLLLVEDNPVNQELAQRLLEKAGCQVTLAANGSEAVDCFERDSFDAILMDMQMPVMDGIEATQAIRTRELRRSWVASHEGFRQVPIIAMTANAMAGDRERCLQAGMTDYVAKPIRQAELLAALARATGGAAAPAAKPAAPAAAARYAAIDPEAAARDIGDPDLVREMGRMLLAQWTTHLDTIASTLTRREAAELCRAAHTFKGLLAMFHAEAARRHALALELAAKDARWEEAAGAAEALKTACETVHRELQAAVGM